MCTSDVGLRFVPEDGYSMPESQEVNNLIYAMFIFALVLGFITIDYSQIYVMLCIKRARGCREISGKGQENFVGAHVVEE